MSVKPGNYDSIFENTSGSKKDELVLKRRKRKDTERELMPGKLNSMEELTESVGDGISTGDGCRFSTFLRRAFPGRSLTRSLRGLHLINLTFGIQVH